MEITREITEKLLSVVDQGLCSGLGEPIPGKMCVEAAVCFALGETHNDKPSCVADSVRSLKIRLNDSLWSLNKARAAGMRRLAVAQLGTLGFDENEFAAKVTRMTIQKIVPRALRTAASVHPLQSHKDALEAAAKLCEENPSKESARAAQKVANSANAASAVAAYAASAAAYAAAYAASAAIFAAYAANVAVYAANAAAYAANVANAASYAVADAARDSELAFFAEEVVKILTEMETPGSKFLFLTELS